MQKIKRQLAAEVLAMSRLYPIVTIVGPRQSGKTTLAKMLFPKKPYISMESPDERAIAENDPVAFFSQFKNGAIIDEVQRVPHLLSYLQTIVDAKEKNGLFILTGSNQLQLQEAISQSLAGRTAILKLLPFSIAEIKKIKSQNVEKLDFAAERYIFHGAYPKIYKDEINPTKFYRDYLQTYIERDVRQLINLQDLRQFQIFLKLCAGRVGQIFNAQNLANEVGVSHTTIQKWLGVLEASFLIFKLSPYFENFGKRVIKSPKIYFTDVGLACYLLDIRSEQQLSRDPLRGGLFENFVILEMYKHQMNKGLEPSFYFYRDSNGNEVDCLYKDGSALTPIEIKAAQTFDKKFFSGVNKFSEVCGKRAKRGVVVYGGKRNHKIQEMQFLGFESVDKIFM